MNILTVLGNPALSDVLAIILICVIIVAMMIALTYKAHQEGAGKGWDEGHGEGRKAGYREGMVAGERIGYSKACAKHIKDLTAAKEEVEILQAESSVKFNQISSKVAALTREIDTQEHAHKNEIARIERSREIRIVDALTIDETADALGCDPKTLYRWRKKGQNLNWYTFNGSILYKRPEVEAFLEAATDPNLEKIPA